MKIPLCCLILLALPFAVAASGKSKPVSENTETVIVPFESGKLLEGQKPDQFYVPYERFVELWEAAKASRR